LEAQVARLCRVIQMLSEQLSHVQRSDKFSAPVSSFQLPTHPDAHLSPSTDHTTSAHELELLPPSIGVHPPSNEPCSIFNDSELKADEGGLNVAAMHYPFFQTSNLSRFSTLPIDQVRAPPPGPLEPCKWSSSPIMEGAFAAEHWVAFVAVGFKRKPTNLPTRPTTIVTVVEHKTKREIHLLTYEVDQRREEKPIPCHFNQRHFSMTKVSDY